MFKNVSYSLADLAGKDFVENVINANAFFDADKRADFEALAYEKVEFYPEAEQKKADALLEKVGTKVIDTIAMENKGAGTDSYQKALNTNAAPLSGRAYYRLGEDGKLYFVGKSEHYHASIGHNFPGYDLIDNARELGILNATHNNTRGYITRILERELVRTVNGIAEDDTATLQAVLDSKEKHVLNRIINLETGSLADEAAVKMMLNRFYELGANCEPSKYAGRVPVFFVIADNAGGTEANYHGTTIITQTFRNIWPSLYKNAEESGLYKVVPVMINDIEDFKNKIEEYNKPPYKTAGFMHEIVLMNYGGVLLDKEYLQQAYELCREYDTPTLIDEIQSCAWYKELFLFRKYDLQPDFVIIGKGFSGGEYPASKVITTAEMDTLNQFGALVTNGQEELASLAYLITMKFVQDNGDIIETNQAKFLDGLKALAVKYNGVVKEAAGYGFLSAIVFDELEVAAAFAKKINKRAIDVSAQTYKANCPAAVLIKLPVVTSEAAVDYLLQVFEEELREM